MKSDLSYLPENKRTEILKIVSIIKQTHLAEMIILFGSYARNSWVEEKYDDEHYRYQSDIDILIIVETKSEFSQIKLERDIETQIDLDQEIKTPTSIIVQDIHFFNRRLKKAQYFFIDIVKEGILLFDTKKYQLESYKELPAEERKKLAENYFHHYLKEADEFKKGVMFYLKEKHLSKSVFLLHQMIERLYAAILLVFTHYKPNTHNLAILRKLTLFTSSELITVFPLDSPEEHRLFKLICKAYVSARYKINYRITENELLQLINRAEKLRKIGYTICLKKIGSFT